MAKPRADRDLWAGPPELLAQPPAYTPRTVAELGDCLLDLERFSETTWSNYAVVKRLGDLKEALRPALGSQHPLCRRIEELKRWARHTGRPEFLCRRIARLRAYALEYLPADTSLVPLNRRWR